MCGATFVFLLGVAGSDDNLYVAFIGLAGAALGSVALVYTSRYKAKHPEEMYRQPPLTDMAQMGHQSYEASRRMDRTDDRVDRLEHQVDYNTRRLDRHLAPHADPDSPDDES